MSGKAKTRHDEFGRVCTKCHNYKLWSEFNNNAASINSLNGRFSCCRQCQSTARKGKRREDEYFRKYGLLLGQFDLMFEKQNGKCAICQRKLVKRKVEGTNFALIDHDHITGRVRGLLCIKCNDSVGVFDKNRELYLAYFERANHEVESLPRSDI